MNLVKGEAKRTSDSRTRCFRGGKSLYQVHWGVQVVSPLRTLPEITAAFHDEGEKTGAIMAECLRAGTFEGKNPCPQRSKYKVLISICTGTQIVNKDKYNLF
jgi:hypothetical protein